MSPDFRTTLESWLTSSDPVQCRHAEARLSQGDTRNPPNPITSAQRG